MQSCDPLVRFNKSSGHGCGRIRLSAAGLEDHEDIDVVDVSESELPDRRVDDVDLRRRRLGLTGFKRLIARAPDRCLGWRAALTAFVPGRAKPRMLPDTRPTRAFLIPYCSLAIAMTKWGGSRLPVALRHEVEGLVVGVGGKRV